MKRAMMMAGLVALTMAVVAGSVMAQDAPPSGERPARGERMGQMGFGMDLTAQKAQFDKAVDALKLEGEAKTKVETIRKEYAAKFEEAAKAVSEATRETRREAMQKQRTVMNDYQTAIKAVLTDEQKKQVEEAMLPPVQASVLLATIKEHAETLKVTEEQTKALDALAAEYKPAEQPNIREKMEAIRNSDKSNEEKAKARQELMAEMQKAREAEQAKNVECTAKVAKILNADQMKQALELARKKMPTRGPGTSTERPRRSEGGAGGNTTGNGNSSEPKPDGIVE